MATFKFNGNATHTLGVELELGIVDATTLALSSQSDAILDGLRSHDPLCFKHELVQSCVEVISGVCDHVGEVRDDLSGKLNQLNQAADNAGTRLWWGGTHPFSMWEDQQITDDPRYRSLVTLLQQMARRLVTFGMHVHVGVDSGDKAVMICDRIMQYLPMLLALSSSSPYWQNQDTGIDSYRSKLMEGLPTAGLPSLMRNWSEYVWLVNHMIQTGFINSIRELWWDVRPHHNFGTVEVRVCDMPGNLDHACALTALTQCLVKMLNDEIDEGTYQFDCHPMMVRQNKWRAARYGMDARLVNTLDYQVVPVRDAVNDLINQLRGISQDLGCESELMAVGELTTGPSWANRQRDILHQTGEPSQIVAKLSAR
ncbi:carboxylate-amine ligase [Neorhodopirellula pilleata]|uniref:Putative glutamate--cysteine ligase 2 n=1 Tax=Neorhodopirellula pilleata TaxID=2714738 RepID=A0A5C5ZQR3_9BACT|nr:YbdK family carboxylate-amine ligase [Neorhodopirellula pilleata]TWT89556.1 Carboxylate-amine ligase YbdK [Neorhodopirellula pilleata]